MFDTIIKEVAAKFGLGDKAMPFLQMVLGYITNKDTGGISGLMDKFKSAGLGSLAQSWLGGGANAQSMSVDQVKSVFGGEGGLLGMLTSKLGIGGDSAAGALGSMLPSVIGKLTPGGSIPTSLPAELTALMGNAKDLLSGGAGAAMGAIGAVGGAAGNLGNMASGAVGSVGAAASGAAGALGNAATGAAGAVGGAAASAGGGLLKWLPWVVAAAAGVFLFSYCSKDKAAPTAPAVTKAPVAAPAPAPAAPAPAPAPVAAAPEPAPAPVADAPKAPGSNVDLTVPNGAGVVSSVVNGLPLLKVYFDTGKTDIAPAWAEKSKELIDFLKKDTAAKAVVNGYHDPTGNTAQNIELAKNRAKGVAAALKAAGIDEARIQLEKPAETAGAGGSLAEARRVEISIQK